MSYIYIFFPIGNYPSLVDVSVCVFIMTGMHSLNVSFSLSIGSNKFSKKMRSRTMQRQVLSKRSLAFSIIPTDAWLIILSKLDAKNILNMAKVSSFFTNDYNIVLTSMKLRLGMDSNNLKHLVHVERARHGMHLVALNNTNDIIVQRNCSTIKCLVGRKYDKSINDLAVSRFHGFLQLFDDYGMYDNGKIGNFHVSGHNGIEIKGKKHRLFYGKGTVATLLHGDIVHLAPDTKIMYKVSYLN